MSERGGHGEVHWTRRSAVEEAAGDGSAAARTGRGADVRSGTRVVVDVFEESWVCVFAIVNVAATLELHCSALFCLLCCPRETEKGVQCKFYNTTSAEK